MNQYLELRGEREPGAEVETETGNRPLESCESVP